MSVYTSAAFDNRLVVTISLSAFKRLGFLTIQGFYL